MRLIKFLLAFLILSSCARNYPVEEAEFYGNLEHNYRSYAEYKKSNYDWRVARILYNKANSIENGHVVTPRDSFIGLSGIKLYSTNIRYVELEDFYERLNIVFSAENAKMRYPKELADAQFYFDCWVIEESLQERYSQRSRCKENFIEELTFLEEKLIIVSKEQKKFFDDSLDNRVAYKNTFIPRKTYVVYFDFDSSVITEEGSELLEKFLSDYSSLPNKENYTVRISGHADRVGKKRYNEILSKRRVDTVKHYLIKNGVDGDLIRLSYFGEVYPGVITLDNIKEDLNRRVVVMVTPNK